MFGKTDTATVHLSAVIEGLGGFALNGETDGDGLDDIIVGAPGATGPGGSSGRSYVVFGIPSGPG